MDLLTQDELVHLTPPERHTASLRIRAVLVRLLLVFGAMTVSVASAQSDVHSLENVLKNEPRELISYSADSVTRYSLEGDHLVLNPIQVHALSVFTTQSVTLNGGKIVLRGERGMLVRDDWGVHESTVGKAPMTLEVDLRGVQPTVAIPKLSQALFFPGKDAAAAGLPEQLALLLPYASSQSRPAKHNGTWIFDSGHWSSIERNVDEFTLPLPIKMPDPKYSREARAEHVSGKVAVVMEVLPTGRVADVWLASPMGHGLDTSAVDAAQKYLFKPAIYKGREVGMEMMIEVNFEVF